MGWILDMFIQETIDDLDQRGQQIIQECVAERTYEHRTYNLHDSYGYAVFHKGKMKTQGFLDALAKKPKKISRAVGFISGRTEIIEFLDSYKSTSEFELVIFAAMPYAGWLEDGSGVGRTYKVISMSYDKLKEVRDELGIDGTIEVLHGKSYV